MSVEPLHVDAEGKRRHFEIHGYPVFNPEGNVIQMIEYVLEITDRRMAEEALRNSEAKFREPFDRSPFKMYSCDANGISCDVNMKWVERTGCETSETIGRKLDFLTARDGAERTGSANHAVVCRGDNVQDLPVRYVCRDGAFMDVLLSCSLTPEHSGDERSITIIQDVTEQRGTQEELYRLKAGIEQSNDSIVITDAHWTMLYVKPNFSRVSGYPRGEGIGRHFLSLQGDPANEVTWREVEKTLAAGRPCHINCLSRRKSGTKYGEEVTLSPVMGGGGKVLNYLIMKRDVTEKRRLESIVEAANLMDNIGFCFSGIRHEIGNSD